MSTDPNETMVAKAVRSELLTASARVAMVLATTVGLPLAGTVLWMIWTAAVAISGNVDNIMKTQDMMKQELKYELQIIKGDLNAVRNTTADHETRLRVIEGKPPMPIPR